MAQQIFPFSVSVQLFFRVHRQDIPHKIQIAERHPRLERVDRDAAVGPEHVIHVQLADPLFGFLLKGRGVRREIGVLIAEQLVGNLPGEQNPDVGPLMNGPAEQIHAHAGPDGGDVKAAQRCNHGLQRGEDLIGGHVHLGVLAADMVRHLPGILQVDGVGRHADGKGLNRLPAPPLGDRADQRGIQPAREQKAHLCVGHQALFHPGNQLFADVSAHGLQIIRANGVNLCNIGIADKFPSPIIAAGREGPDALAQPHQVFRLAGKHNDAGRVVAVIQGADADGVAGGDVFPGFAVVEDAGELGVQHGEHAGSVLAIQGKQNLAVAAAAEGVAFCGQLLLQPRKAVNLPVADRIAAVQLKRLHSGRSQPHDGETVKAEQPASGIDDFGVVRPARGRACKAFGKRRKRGAAPTVTHDRTHNRFLRNKRFQHSIGQVLYSRCHLYLFFFRLR